MLTGEKQGGVVLGPRPAPRLGPRMLTALFFTFFLLILLVAKDQVLLLASSKGHPQETPHLDMQQVQTELKTELAAMVEAIWSMPAADAQNTSAANPWDRLRLESERFAEELRAAEAEADLERRGLEEARERLEEEKTRKKKLSEAGTEEDEAKISELRQQLAEAKRRLALAQIPREELSLGSTNPASDRIAGGLGRGFATSSCSPNATCQHRSVDDGTLTVFPASEEALLCSSCLEGGQKTLEFPEEEGETVPRPSEGLCYRYCCSQCTVLLLPLPMQSESTMFSQTYPIIPGMKNAHIYQAMAPDGKISIVKFNCIQGFGQIGAMRYGHPARKCLEVPERLLLPLAVYTMSSEAGIADVAVAHWSEMVHSITPVTGVPVETEGLFMEPASGVPLEHLFALAPEDGLLSLLAKVPTNDIAQAAVLDLLFHNCERGPENVFLTEEGRLRLIDHDRMLASNEGCPLDSVFLPGTVSSEKLSKRYRSALDYRCRVSGGAIGTNYPPAVTSFLLKVRKMNSATFSTFYGLPGDNHFSLLKATAEDMLSHGFETSLVNVLEREITKREQNQDDIDANDKQTMIPEPHCNARQVI